MINHTTQEVAAELRCSSRKVREEAARLGIGFNLGGRAGWRFSRADIEAIKSALTPATYIDQERESA